MARMLTNHVSSYRDLPKYVYQFETKFRNELRAKSGIMRGREFTMKDMYSFSKNEAELEAFYENAGIAYENVFRRAGIGDLTYLTFATGGMFSKFSHEFQCVSTAGEDTIFIDTDKRIAVNEEVMTEDVLLELKLDRNSLVQAKSIEVGNIFKLGTRYSMPLGLTYKDEGGKDVPVVMGSYGIGIGRLMGTIVEVLCDEKGIVWPESVAPFRFHLLDLSQGEEKARSYADQLYADLISSGAEVLYDDRDLRAGEKFADSELIGIPYRIIAGKHTSDDAIEFVRRKSGEKTLMSRTRILNGDV
jgi:prolyl-tRNA synthetase